MKTIVVPILILLVATQAFSKWVLLLEFQLNRDYIAANLCENRTKPQTKCGGKCQLMKNMAAEEKDTPIKPQSGKAKFQEMQFSFEKGTDSFLMTTAHTGLALPHYLLKKYTAPATSVFHPPA